MNLGARTLGSSSKFGSKAWANDLLRAGILELKNEDRARAGRFVEVLSYIALLLEYGYWWQAGRLRNWLYRYWSDLQPRKADPRRIEEISL